MRKKLFGNFFNHKLSLFLSFALILSNHTFVFAQQDGRGVGGRKKEESANTQKRLALVIGNSDYQHTDKLTNPVNDATDMARSLKHLGFEVVSGMNQTLLQMRRLIREFGAKLTEQKGIGLFYYAGHGIQFGGRNFLIPVEAEISSEVETEDVALDINAVLRQMDSANNGFNIVILDACRNNPFGRSWKRGGNDGGLAQINAPTGTLIAYATSPDRTASDGTGRNGLYTSELLRQMNTPNLTLEEMFKTVRSEVRRKSNGQQVPWESSSVEGTFYFAGIDNNKITVDPSAGDAAFWRSIEHSTDARDFEDYLKNYPNGIYAATANLKLRKLKESSNTNSNSANTNSTTSNTSGVNKAGATRKNSIGMEFAFIPVGEFLMGSSDTEIGRNKDEEPQHRVTIKEGFYMGRYEVTQAQYEAVTGSLTKCDYGQLDENVLGSMRPVVCVSWSDAKEFIRKLNAKNDGFTYRLPSEAEWEYAARAGTTTAFSFGDSLSSNQASFDGRSPYGNGAKGDYKGKTMPVGSYQPNAWGLYDMHGNVWEWVEDIYNENGYAGLPSDGSANTSKGDTFSRVARGGAFDSEANSTRLSYRDRKSANFRSVQFGFRIIAVPTSNTTPSNTTSNPNNTNKVESIKRNSIGMEFVYIPAGDFMMGTSDAEAQAAYQEEKRYIDITRLDSFDSEKPKHKVTIKDGFLMGRYEVTEAQYQQTIGVNPSYYQGCDNCAVDTVSWDDAKEFIKRLNEKNDGFVYSLPSEAEWEYACRAGTTTVFSLGDSLSPGQANFDETRPYGAAPKGAIKSGKMPVGSFQPNAWGLYDMHGNVAEWVEDIFQYGYNSLPTDGLANTKGDPKYRTLRGGNRTDPGYWLRSAFRTMSFRDDRRVHTGFRVVARLKT